MATIALIIPIGDGSGLGLHPGNALPGGGYPSQPIYHPGHPDHGLPSQPGHPSQGLPGQGGHPSQGLPWSPGHPDNSLPVPPGVGTAPVPPDLAEKIVVLWHLPNTVEWHGKVIDPSLSAGMPLPPAPAPKY